MTCETTTNTGSHEEMGDEFGVEIGNTKGLYAELIQNPVNATAALYFSYTQESLDPTYDILSPRGILIYQKLKTEVDPSWEHRYAKERNTPERHARVYTLSSGIEFTKQTVLSSVWSKLQTELDRLGLQTHECIIEGKKHLMFEKYQHLFVVSGELDKYRITAPMYIGMGWWEPQYEISKPGYTIPTSQTVPPDLTNEAELVSSLRDLAEIQEKTIQASYAIENLQLPSTKVVINYRSKDETEDRTHGGIESKLLSHAVCGYCTTFYDRKQIEVRNEQMIIHEAQCRHCGASEPKLLQTRSKISRKSRERRY